jgi:hypothetical protein
MQCLVASLTPRVLQIQGWKYSYGPSRPKSSKAGPSMVSIAAQGHSLQWGAGRDESTSGQHPCAWAPWASQPAFKSQQCTIHGPPSQEGNETSRPFERAQELYGSAAESLESVTSWPIMDPHEWKPVSNSPSTTVRPARKTMTPLNPSVLSKNAWGRMNGKRPDPSIRPSLRAGTRGSASWNIWRKVTENRETLIS